MSPESILERNLEQLFTRAYAPVRPSAGFRARLARELAQKIAADEHAQPRFAWRAAAAILTAVGLAFVAWRATRAPSAPVDVERLLAAGSAAVREGPARAWREIGEEEARSGIQYEGPSLELATPREFPAVVKLGSTSRIDAGTSTRLSVDGSVREDDLVVSLARGSLSVERDPHGKAWRLSTAEGSVELAGGVLELACADLRGSPATRALLRSGSASIAGEPPAALVAGAEVWLQDGALVATTGLETPVAAGTQRTDAGTNAGPETSAPESSAPATGSLRGTIAWPAGAGAPEAYLVTLLRRERLPEVSAGRSKSFTEPAFAIDGLKPGTYSVFVEAEGYAAWQRSGVELAPGPTPVALEIVLDAGASVRGRVLDPDGRPVEGASVLSETDVPSQLLPFSLAQLPSPAKWNAVATSGPDGTFELAHLSRGLHRLRASHPGYGAAWSDVIDLTPKDSGGGAADLTLRLVRAGAIEGFVARDDGAPWPSAVVVASSMDAGSATTDRTSLNYSSAVADGEGHYAIEDLPPGQFVVLNVLEGRQPGAGRVPRVQMVRVEPGVRTRVDLPGSVLGTALAGTLLANDGAPLGDFDVTLVPKLSDGSEGTDWKSTRTRADGRFDFPSLLPGTYAIYVGADLGTQLALQGILEVPAVPTFATTLRAGAGVLRGRVLDDKSGEGLASCAVVVQMETPEGSIFAGRSVTDAQGRYSLPRLLAGRYRATAYAGVIQFGQETAGGISIGEGASETALDFRLRPGASLLLKVVDAGGKALSGARLRFQQEHGDTFSFSPEDRTDASGQLHIRGIQPGRWTVFAASEGFENASTAVDLAAGEERTVEITLTSPR